jgi:hypothetical protein
VADLRYWHGGAPGLNPGDKLLPPDLTGTSHTLSAYVTDADNAPHAQRRDLVYVTTSKAVARAYAAFYLDGALYEVAPADPIEPDPDCYEPGLSWQCPAATVTAIVDPIVLFRTRPVGAWLRILGRSPR